MKPKNISLSSSDAPVYLALAFGGLLSAGWALLIVISAGSAFGFW